MTMNSMVRALALAILVLFLAVCHCTGQALPTAFGRQGTQESSAAQATARSDSADSNRPALQRRDWRYRLRPSDVIGVNFSVTEVFNQLVAVQPDGYITLRAVGDLRVEGQSIPEVTETIRAAYARIVSPQVIAIELKEFEKPYFIVSGEVARPGKFELRGDTTVAEAVGIAGGFRDTARHSQVLLFRRVSNDWMEARKLDLKKMLRAGNLSEDLHLRPGDMLFVPKNTISKIKPFLPIPGFGFNFNPSQF